MKTMTVNSPLSPIKGKIVPSKAFRAFFATWHDRPGDDWVALMQAHYRAACHFFPADRDAHKAFTKAAFVAKRKDLQS